MYITNLGIKPLHNITIREDYASKTEEARMIQAPEHGR